MCPMSYLVQNALHANPAHGLAKPAAPPRCQAPPPMRGRRRTRRSGSSTAAWTRPSARPPPRCTSPPAAARPRAPRAPPRPLLLAADQERSLPPRTVGWHHFVARHAANPRTSTPRRTLVGHGILHAARSSSSASTPRLPADPSARHAVHRRLDATVATAHTFPQLGIILHRLPDMEQEHVSTFGLKWGGSSMLKSQSSIKAHGYPAL